MSFLIGQYAAALKAQDRSVAQIKWHRELDRRLTSRQPIAFEVTKTNIALYRPFTTKFLYFDRLTNSQSFRLHEIFQGEPNPTITFLGVASTNPLAVLSTSMVFDTCLLKNGNGSTQGAPRYRYTKSGERVDNITDWAVNKFVAQYGKRGITKDAIFNYVYAVLHDPVYRESYALNLRREFPRIPFHADFARWAAWGKQLMTMHIGFEDVEPWPLERTDTISKKRAEGTYPKPVLRSVYEDGTIRIDSNTQIGGIPSSAWTYRLGNRSAIDWVLDQHKEKVARDPMIRERFRSYRFSDHKEEMIDRLARIVRVSVETVAIIQAMAALRSVDKN